jgi:hypothetical protein
MGRHKSGLLLAVLLAALTGCHRPGEPTRPKASGERNTLLIAPHIQGEVYCPQAAADPSVVDEDVAAAVCARARSNGATRVSALLDAMGPRTSPSGRYALGYTLTLPLMRYVRADGRGWSIDSAELANELTLVRDVDRPVVILLSADHFRDSGAALVDRLAQDERNLMWTPAGPLRLGRYFGLPVNAWTFADPEAPIAELKRRLVAAAVAEICRLDAPSKRRIAAVDLLGETHQLYPSFPDPPGYGGGFVVTDYSPASRAAFQAWLAQRFGTIGAFNQAVGGAFADFGKVEPPSRDMTAAGGTRLAHLDSAAAGRLAIYGWAYDPNGPAPRIALFVDGVQRATTIADLNRLDVPEADKTVRTPNVGWRLEYDYRGLAPGVHTLELRAEAHGRVVRFGARRFVVLSKPGETVGPLDTPVPPGTPDSAGLRLVIDGPAPDQPVLFNPLAELWLAYRNAQITHVYEAAADQAATCLPRTQIFSHQIAPQLYGSWNPDLMAVDASQARNPHYLPGTTLYGGSAFGDAFFRFKDRLGWTSYGVSELHPTFPLSVAEMEAMLDRHRRAGARYVAPFYMYVVPARITPTENKLTSWRIMPDNSDPRYGAASFYRAIQDLMRRG